MTLKAEIENERKLAEEQGFYETVGAFDRVLELIEKHEAEEESDAEE